jgi:hypothetical protein
VTKYSGAASPKRARSGLARGAQSFASAPTASAAELPPSVRMKYSSEIRITPGIASRALAAKRRERQPLLRPVRIEHGADLEVVDDEPHVGHVGYAPVADDVDSPVPTSDAERFRHVRVLG